MGQRRFVGLDRKVEVALAISNLAKKRRRFGQRRLEFDRLLQEQRRVMFAALQMRRDARAKIQNRIARMHGEGLAEGRGRLVRIAFLNGHPTCVGKFSNRRLRRQARRRQGEQTQHRCE